MDTEKMFVLNGELDGLPFSELAPDDLKKSIYHVEISRHFLELHHLFLIFIYNIKFFQGQYLLTNSDMVYHIRDNKLAISDDDYIAINANVTNIIAAGKTLVDSMDSYINENQHTNQDTIEKFNEFKSTIYDSSFSYRLLYNLRNFSQHGHLPVSKRGEQYCFDLKQILDKPHFKHNKTFKSQMKDIIEEITTKYKDAPDHAFTITIAEYVTKLLSIYNFFWTLVKCDLDKSYRDFKKIIKAYPENIIPKGIPFESYFIYKIDYDDNNSHAVYTKDNPKNSFNAFREEAKNKYNEFKQSFYTLINGSVFVSQIMV